MFSVLAYRVWICVINHVDNDLFLIQLLSVLQDKFFKRVKDRSDRYHIFLVIYIMFEMDDRIRKKNHEFLFLVILFAHMAIGIFWLSLYKFTNDFSFHCLVKQHTKGYQKLCHRAWLNVNPIIQFFFLLFSLFFLSFDPTNLCQEIVTWDRLIEVKIIPF